MNFGKLKTRLIQGLALIAAALAMGELLVMMLHSALDILVCFVTIALLVAQVFWKPQEHVTKGLVVLHAGAALNLLAAILMLLSKDSAHLEDFRAHSIVFPLTAYLLWFSRHMTTKFTRVSFAFGLGVASLVSVSAFALISIVFHFIVPPSGVLQVRTDAMPLFSALLVLIVAGNGYLDRLRYPEDTTRRTLLILLAVALITSAGALTARRVFMDTMLNVEASRARTLAEICAHRIENELANLAEAFDRMADRIAVGAYPDIAAWQSDADNYVTGFDSLSGIGWMDENFRFMQASPAALLPMGKEVGPDFSPVRKENLLQAAETQEVTVSAPFEFGLTTAQVAMVAPIVRDGQTIGLLGNALNLEALFSEISREVGDTFAYSVTEGEQLVFAKGNAQDFHVQSTIHAISRDWTLSVPISGEALIEAYVWGQRFAFTRILAFIVIVFAVERARLAQSKNQKLQARNSDLVAAQTIMESQEAEISLMRSSLAHDLKSPIRNVRTVTTMWDQLKEAKGLTDQDLKDRILDNLTRLEKLSLSFTDFLSARVALVQKEPMALTDFLHDVERRFADRCRINVQTDGPMVIETDRLLLARVFDNLVENAINASEDGNVQITVSVTEAAGLYSIHFRDNGRGIPAALRERIFKPFDTGDGKRRPDSSGLGLTIVRRLIGNLDGTVTCVDPGAQGGAVFVIELPKA